MSFNRYFQEELLALRELGKEFSERNPALAPFLTTAGRDPDVERILEGFAFLSGRLRQKLDDELPEFTHSLFNLLWPNYLRPIPASSIIAYQPGDNISSSVTIPSGTMVESVPVEGTRCKFRTVYTTDIYPLHLDDMRIIERHGEASIALHFKTLKTALENIPLRHLRFFLAGEQVVAHTLYFTLVNRVREVRIVMRDAQMEERVTTCLPAKNLRPVGFREDEGLYPYPANTFPGYRILQEYFCFPEKFLFVELSGLEQGFNRDILQNFQGADSFEIHFVLKELPEMYDSFRAENWRLFCTPAVNLFSMDACPLALNQRQTEYRIVPEPRLPFHYAVYSVDKVGVWGVGGRNNRRYLPFESFEHEGGEEKNVAYYRLRTRSSHRDSGVETYISFVQTGDNAAIPVEETVSLDITCTNRMLPKELGMGDIRIHADKNATTANFSNITPVIPSFNPPLEGNILWRLLSNMSLNYISLIDVHALRAVLSAYDFRALHDKTSARILEKIMKSMVRISCTETDRIYRGLPVRGAQTRLVLDQKGFSCEGAMYLFGSVLNEFFVLYATVNSFHQLIIEEVSRGEEYRWPARLGRTLHI
ncbi:MAG: type VI secretion system baseplate subunit TssF [Desulfovibrio sp.]|jgi:type VI secretion system protein ImpG|nr:type VI secretion system baseplate subunit TssF [Desulfovibrio sp.]